MVATQDEIRKYSEININLASKCFFKGYKYQK